MQRCFELAKLGAGNVAPNPMVGAILVYDDKIIGEGHHKKYGEAHAEVNCINSVKEEEKELIPKSTLYVSLEPCAHYGKTPPCADLIIKHKIPNVIIGCRDSYDEVNGKGIEKLKAAGVNVIVGILETEALELNRRFFTFYQRHRPYVILKWARSNDNKIANADLSRVFISNEEVNRLVHKWRSEEAAILVGTNTALRDDPSLTTRLWQGHNPVRLVIDKELKLPSSLHLFDNTVKTVIFNNVKNKEEGNTSYYQLKTTSLKEILNVLYEQKIQSMIVEGGSKLLQAFIDEGLWDETRIITNNELSIQNGLNAPVLKNDIFIKEEVINNNSIGYYKKK
ncbi:bifunctional diaminohydroxyphosphoribosylaminopyrimidine deaminase/5-amino-6-(5-phosphoribosylamino)uracil reductase RibD [Ferruginibacter albus]|uniref:bifunctional diaminohydroxyphosphoribosylaminopyrimidine deaminase/5-amino-6-(5-phosphoribosylamino)uracil reductase RibD n=1 Tax=Ferruginibacter albus TaxID=2875540 RepID=UPI001CC6E978|nr:bifunctional diaminohydroxyphosphoribosylaminopyrimidine deaminase/5-amino-6-(5-phosphoribosylamino)uracil reductase RibD [Ferruginibacter albus]UAY52449.1 bifunctional diaminohydroxyphosphoribosylaminopyrimidine deaminase/5-amino-6-(5-phosphoribosylamino)uracil reductase RibD [Ferruginibacter albus]